MALAQRKDFELAFGSKEDFRAFLMQHSSMLGIYAWKNGKFSFRSEENTPSCTVNAGWFYDHGSGKSGNILDLIMLGRGLSNDTQGFKEACRVAEEMLNIPRNNSVNGLASNNYTTVEKIFQPSISDSKRNEWYTNKINYPEIFYPLFQGLSRNLNEEQRKKVEEKLEIGLSIEEVIFNKGKSNQTSFIDRRALLPFIDSDNLVWNYCAYNRNSKLKGAKRKDGKPSVAGENLIKYYQRDILWVEGDSDYVHAQGFDLNAVTAGSASMRITQFLPKFKGKNIYFLVDNDKAGATAIARWHNEIREYNETVSSEDKVTGYFLWWSDKSYNLAITETKRLINDYYVKKLLPNAEQLANQSISELNISIMINDGIVRKKGYDLTDYIFEFKGQAMEWFYSKFKTK